MSMISNKILKYLYNNDDNQFKDISLAFNKNDLPSKDQLNKALDDLSDKIELESIYNYRGILIVDNNNTTDNKDILLKARITEKGREHLDERKIKIGTFTIQKFGLYLAIGTLFLAILTFIFSFFKFNSNKNLFQLESIPVLKTETALFQYTKNSLIVPHFWKCTIINNSEKPLILLDYNLKYSNSGQIFFYTGIDQGLFDLNLEKINLPLEVDPFKTKAFYIKVGILTDSIVTATLIKSDLFNRRINTRDVKVELAKKNLDIFGNKVDAKIENDMAVYIGAPSSYNEQEFILKFRTPQNEILPIMLTYYPKLEDMQKSNY